MSDLAQPGVLPLRPMTTGELLDAAVVLLRTRGRALLGYGALLSLLEQAALFRLRRAADVNGTYLPGDGLLWQYGILIVFGLGAEAFCIALLGAAAARRAPQALLGRAAPPPGRARPVAVLTAALVAGVVVASSGWAFLVAPVPLQVLGLFLATMATAACWPFAYGLVGLAAPAVVVDQVGAARAVARSLRLATAGLRAMWIRVLGYLCWLFIRLGLGLATLAVVSLAFTSPSNVVDNLVMGATWLVVNAIAYPVLGCLDVALHLEARMRTEGLDLTLRRFLHRGVSTGTALAVPR